MVNNMVEISVANEQHTVYAAEICSMMEEAARIRGTGIAKRSVDYVQDKMREGKAVIALGGSQVVGFCYIEIWENGKYLANSGLIVHPEYRNTGLARHIKSEVFKLSRKKYTEAKIFGITTSYAVMKINSDLGYKPVTFSELTIEENFWKGCQSCVNFDILTRTQRKHCLCTGMMYDPKVAEKNGVDKTQRWERFKNFLKQHMQIPQTFFNNLIKATTEQSWEKIK